MRTIRTRTAVAVCTLSLITAVAAVIPSPASATGATPPKADRAALTARQVHATARRSVAKSPTSSLARSDEALLARKDATPVAVVVKYDYDSIATYRGSARGPAATAPAATGRALTEATATTSAYARSVARQEATINAAVEQAVPSARIGTRLRVVYGGVAMVVPANQARKLLKVPGVVAVQEDSVGHLLTDSSPEFLGAPPVWATQGGQATAGAGVLFADLDSGVWPEHPSFAENPDLPARPTRPGGGDLGCSYGDNPLTPADDPFTCTNKLAGGYAFLDTYNSIHDGETFPDTARDSDGHGTHTTSTAAGDIVEHANPLGVDRGTISGLAPGAAVAEYKVCGASGCFGSDSADAVAQAILDGADVINYSISGGTDPMSDPAELAFLDAYDAGVFVAASAGNEGPDASTANHLSPWVTTVAASTQPRAFSSTLSLTGADDATLDLTGASITAGVSDPTPVVFAGDAPYSHARCDAEPASADEFAGKIVACERGGNARIEKGYNLSQGGAAGMILYNPSLADTETDNHWLPAVHLADGTELLDFADAHGPLTATFTPGTKSTGQGDVMASFSSRGPAGSFIKPDVTAPGVQILAGQTPVLDAVDLGPEGEYFQAIAGTSMSGPHVAGAAILVKAAHPDWTPGQIHSALMTTATTAVVKEDEETPADPFDMGSGRIRIDAAVSPGLTLDETATNFADLTGTGNAIDLNIPSVNAPIMPGRESTTRTFTNVGSGTATYQVTTSAPSGSTISVTPNRFTVAPGKSQTVTITITSDSQDGGQRFGAITLAAPGRTALHLPVAWVPTQGTLSTTSTCDDTTIATGDATSCDVTVRNDAFADTTVDVDASVNDRLTITDAGPDATHTDSTASASGIELAGRQPGVPALEAQDGFDGFVELSGDLTPDAIGDEEFLTYSGLGSIVYNGQTYSEVNVNSNGYLVLGPATSEDDVCCPPQHTPDSAPPNNIIAPFWSDLAGDTGTPDGEAPLGIYGAIFSDDATGDQWLVLESRLTDCCDGDDTHSTKVSQVWLGLNGVQDITIDYPSDNIPTVADIEQAPGDPLALVSVQNELGAGDEFDPEADPLPTDFFVTSTDPVPGDSYTMHLDLEGSAAGAGVLTGEVTSPDVHGTTVVDTAITVGPGAPVGTDAYITRAYQDFLGRNPTAKELEDTRNLLAMGSLSRHAFISSLALTDEYLGHVVDERYQQVLDRDPDAAGRTFWVSKLRSGLTEVGLVASLVGSGEFLTKAGGDTPGFVDRAYQVLLDRAPDPAGRQSWIDAVESGTPRHTVGATLYQSSESRRHRVRSLYLQFLHRSPDAGGLAYWMGVIRTRGDVSLAISLGSSNEYANRTL